MIPVFVLGFIACVLVRSAGIPPYAALTLIGHAQTIPLGAALFGLGTAVRLHSLASSTVPAIAVGAVSTATLATVSLAGVLVLGRAASARERDPNDGPKLRLRWGRPAPKVSRTEV